MTTTGNHVGATMKESERSELERMLSNIIHYLESC